MMRLRDQQYVVLSLFVLVIAAATTSVTSYTTSSRRGGTCRTIQSRKPCRKLAILPTIASTTILHAIEGKNENIATTFDNNGVIELGESNNGVTATSTTSNESIGSTMTQQQTTPAAAPFLSQGNEMDPQALNPDMSDPKQVRVIIYIILSLLPVLFLIPLMIGSRDLIPLDSIPPVQI